MKNTTTHKLISHFAPPERVPLNIIKKESRDVAQTLFNTPLLKKLFDSLPDIVLILNKNRQIIFANDSFLPVAGVKKSADVYGMRPGEAVHCIHARENHAGCGTTKFCSECGAVRAILLSQKGSTAKEECRIITTGGASLDLSVCTTPLQIGKELYVLAAILDISNEKRRRALERIFFHDILNTSGALWGYTDILKNEHIDKEKHAKFIESTYRLSRRLIDEIETQKIILAAESKEVSVNPTNLGSHDILKDVVSTYDMHPVARDKKVEIDPASQDLTVKTDKVMLMRVISNMLKNALEAVKQGDTVTVGSKKEDGKIMFWVKNPGMMPEKVQLQIFQRSFSTKGEGRGLGTYSIKLLGEQYLKGKAGFISTKEEGTTFFLIIPKKI